MIPGPTGIIARIVSAAAGVAIVVCIINMTQALTTSTDAASDIFAQLLAGGAVVQLRNLKPTGGAAIRFDQSTISWAPPSQFVEPKRTRPAPYGS